MAKKPKRKPDDEAQSQRFIDKAKELGIDKTAEAPFIDTVDKISTAAHKDQKSKDHKKY